MYHFKTALQLYSVREEMKQDFKATLQKVKEMGYEGVEFAGLFGHSAKEVKEMCKELGLVPVSAHVPYAELLKGDETFQTYAEIGCRFIVIPWVGGECHAGGEKNEEFIAHVKWFGELANKYGMRLCYHNHDFEFEKFEGAYKLDLLYKAVSGDLLETQLDTCWVNVGGVNPAEYIRKYADRVTIVHLKDFVGAKSENMYGLIGKAEEDKKKAEGNFEFRPVGGGLQNMPEILKASEEVGAEWVVVEQDQPCPGRTPVECAQESIRYLRSIGV